MFPTLRSNERRFFLRSEPSFLPFSYHYRMNILGIDWGEKRIGLAVSEGSFAEPFGLVSSFEELSKVIRREGVRQVILGLPEGKHEKRVRELSRRIEEELGVPVILRSEVLT